MNRFSSLHYLTKPKRFRLASLTRSLPHPWTAQPVASTHLAQNQNSAKEERQEHKSGDGCDCLISEKNDLCTYSLVWECEYCMLPLALLLRSKHNLQACLLTELSEVPFCSVTFICHLLCGLCGCVLVWVLETTMLAQKWLC